MPSIDPIRAGGARDTRPTSARVRRAAAASVLLALTAAGCGDGATGPSGPGTGQLSASGAVSASGSGIALFQSASSGGTSLFQVMVAPTSAAAAMWQLQIVSYTGRPAVGTYAISPLSASSTNPTANFYYASGGSMQLYIATSGQLVITTSSPSAVAGTFTFTATNTDGPGTVTAEGSFNAQCAPGTACQ